MQPKGLWYFMIIFEGPELFFAVYEKIQKKSAISGPSRTENISFDGRKFLAAFLKLACSITFFHTFL